MVTVVFLVSLVVIFIYMVLPEKKTEKAEPLPVPPELRIEVNNGCGMHNLAQDVSTLLLEKNVIVVSWGNIDNPRCIYDETMIVIRHKNQDTSKKLKYLRELTGISKFTEAQKENARAEFEIILGKDYFKYFKL
jgi:hypothetical protein